MAGSELTVRGLLRRVKALEDERDKLILAVADHVTVRGELTARRKELHDCIMQARLRLRGIGVVGQYMGKDTVLRDSVLEMFERAIAGGLCAHDWSFDGENAEGTEAEFSCHKCGTTSVAKEGA